MHKRHAGFCFPIKSRYITDKYLIIELTDSEMRYEHMKSGTKFKLSRVKEGFEFP